MTTKSLKKLEDRIAMLHRQLSEIEAMRPGTLSLQYRQPAEKKHPFYQLSYTHKGRSRSEYVRTENLATIRREIKAYKRFKTLTEKLVELSIEASRLRIHTRKNSK